MWCHRFRTQTNWNINYELLKMILMIWNDTDVTLHVIYFNIPSICLFIILFHHFPAAGEEGNMDLPDNNDLLASVESTSELPTAAATSPDVGKWPVFQFDSSGRGLGWRIMPPPTHSITYIYIYIYIYIYTFNLLED